MKRKKHQHRKLNMINGDIKMDSKIKKINEANLKRLNDTELIKLMLSEKISDDFYNLVKYEYEKRL